MVGQKLPADSFLLFLESATFRCCSALWCFHLPSSPKTSTFCLFTGHRSSLWLEVTLEVPFPVVLKSSHLGLGQKYRVPEKKKFGKR